MSFYRLINMMINHTLPVYEIRQKVMAKTRLLDNVRNAIRVRQYRLSTEKVYIAWIRRFTLFHGKRHPTEMEKFEIEAFLTHLAVNRAAPHFLLVVVLPVDYLLCFPNSHLPDFTF